MAPGLSGCTSVTSAPPLALEAEGVGQARGQVLDADADVAAHDLAVGDEAVGDVADEVGRDREADALEAAAVAEDRGVDADRGGPRRRPARRRSCPG